MLDDGQVQQFSEQGWIVADDVLSVAEVAELRTILQQPPFVERSFSEDHAVHFLNITTLHPKFLELAKDPRIVGRITPLLGPNIQLHHSKTCTKPSTPGKGEFLFHQDFAYYPHTNALQCVLCRRGRGRIRRMAAGPPRRPAPPGPRPTSTPVAQN